MVLHCFSGIMTDLNKGVTKLCHHIRLWRDARSDIMFQICFVEKKIPGDHFSWVTFGKHPTRLSYIMMHAVRLIGFGAVFGRRF